MSRIDWRSCRRWKGRGRLSEWRVCRVGVEGVEKVIMMDGDGEGAFDGTAFERSGRTPSTGAEWRHGDMGWE